MQYFLDLLHCRRVVPLLEHDKVQQSDPLHLVVQGIRLLHRTSRAPTVETEWTALVQSTRFPARAGQPHSVQGDYRVLPGDPPARGAMVGTYGALIKTAVSELSPRQAEAVTPRASPAAKDTIE